LPIRKFVLSERGRGISCDANGAFIESIPLLKQSSATGAAVWHPRDVEAVSDELSTHFGLPIDMSSKASALKAIARALNDSNIARTELVTLHIQFPDPPHLTKGALPQEDAANFIRQLVWSGFLKANFNPNQPRWPSGSPESQGGRWSPKGTEAEAGIGHNQGPPLEAEAEAVAGEAEEAGEAAITAAGTATAALATGILLATTEPLDTGNDDTVAKINRHHSWPKYLGGQEKQELAKLPKWLHDQYHRGLDEIAKRTKGTAYFNSFSPAARQRLMNEVMVYTKDFDAQHGTHLYESMLKNGFPAPQ
jgi:hypothetical protein